MKFTCESCHARYSIADEKVRGKILKIRCKQCGATVTVRETASALPAVAAPGTPLERAFDAVVGRASDTTPPESNLEAVGGIETLPTPRKRRATSPATKVAAAESAAPSKSRIRATQLVPAEEWYLAVNGQQFGPMSLQELQARLRRSEAAEEDHVWSEGFEAWMMIRDVPELAGHFHPKPPPLPQDMVAMRPPTPPVSASMFTPFPGQLMADLAAPTATAAPSTPAVVVRTESGLFRLPTSELKLPGGVAALQVTAAPEVAPAANPLLVPNAFVAAQSQPQRWVKAGVIATSLVAVGLLTLAGVVLLRSPQAPVAQPAPSPTAPAPPATQPVSPAPTPVQDEPMAATPTPTAEEPKANTTPRSSNGIKSSKSAAVPAAPVLTEEQRRLAELYGTASEVAPDVKTGSAAPIKKNVTSADIDQVRTAHQTALKICYERAAKRDPALKSIRIDVDVDVATGGRVTRVGLSSQSGTQLGDCLTQSIRRWAFPNTGEDYSLGFPIIFQGG